MVVSVVSVAVEVAEVVIVEVAVVVTDEVTGVVVVVDPKRRELRYIINKGREEEQFIEL